MPTSIENSKYKKIIRTLTWRKNLLKVITFLFTLIIFVFMFPIKIALPFGDGALIDFDGLPIWIALPLLIACYFLEVVLFYKTVSPALTKPLTEECDPEKYLELNLDISGTRELTLVCSSAYLFLGEFDKSISYSKEAAADRSYRYALTGLYNKAMAELLIGNTDAVKKTARAFNDILNGTDKIPEKDRLTFKSMTSLLDLAVAISDNNADKIAEIKSTINLENAGKQRSATVLARYVVGLSDMVVGDKDSAQAHFEWLKENAKKTVFPSLADKRLKELNRR